MPTRLRGEERYCERCGAALPERLGGMGCLPCLLRAGMEADDAAHSAADFGTRFYHHFEILTWADGSPWELGRGAMGVTYKAVDVNLRVPVALKVINGRFSTQPGAQRRFLHEAQAAARLRHPNVASVFHFGVVNALPATVDGSMSTIAGPDLEGGDSFYVMEFIEGETLEARLRRAGPLAPREALEIGLQVARALVAAERHGLVHRDLKPSNIMLLPQEELELHEASGVAGVKVIDFGLVQAAQDAETWGTGAREFLGTPQFASPEQLAGQVLDTRSDVYSLGCTLWYALTGRVPFSRQENDADGALPLEQLQQRRIPSTVVRLLESLLAPDPKNRPVSAVALVERFRESLNELTQLPRPLLRRRGTYALAALAIAAAVVAFFFFFRPDAESPPDNSVAVLPFQNLSSDPRNSYFAAGLEDDLLSSLAKIHNLKVVGRRSSSTYAAEGKDDLRTRGKALGARHLLRGTLRRVGDRVLLQVQLVDARDGHTVWSERYDRTVASSIGLQGELAAAIADALDVTLSAQEQSAIHSQRTLNPNAYLLYLRGRKFENGRAVALRDYEEAETLYRQALAFDPSFALAHARLATTLGYLYRFRGPSEELRTRAHAEAREAIRLQPNLGEAHLARALCYYHIERDFERALPELEMARSLLPNDSEPESFIAYLHRRQGKWRACLSELEQVTARDPQNMSYEEELFATTVLLRQWHRALTPAERIKVLTPDLPQVKVERAYLDFWKDGSLGAARKFFEGYQVYGDPEGDVTWARWDAAMLDRNFPRAEAALDMFPYDTLSAAFGAPLPKAYLAGCISLAKGDLVRAEQFFETARPVMEAESLAHPDDGLRHARLGLLYAYMGKKPEALREGAAAVQLQPTARDAYDGPQRLCNLALIHARLGDNDEAIAMIQSLLRMPGGVSFYEASMSLWDLRLRWQWDPLRSDPRFQRILAGPEPTTIF